MNIKIIIETKDNLQGWFKKYPIDLVLENNNNIFAMLADINNDNEIKTIFDPTIDRVRGVPVDASNEYLDIIKSTKGFSHSYYYLRELKDLEKSGYWRLLTKDNESYKTIGVELFKLIKTLEVISLTQNICHNCIRMCFFFIGEKQ